MTKPIPTLAALSLLLAPGLALRSPGAPRQEGYDALRGRAEKLYEEGSYELAHRAYEQAERLHLEPDEERWVRFRLADTSWRSAAAAQGADTSVLDHARSELLELSPADTEESERGSLWAEARESLADSYWQNPNLQDWGTAWPHYSAALDVWAESSSIERAREHYLGIVWRMTSPAWDTHPWIYGGYARNVDLEVLRNAVSIAKTQEERSHAHWLLGQRYADMGRDPKTAPRAIAELQGVIDVGIQTEWYDDALFRLGRFLEETGRAERGENGWTWQPDYAGALAAYQRLVSEFSTGDSRWRDDAQRRVDQILSPSVSVGVDRFFLPGSEIPFHLSWRNVQSVELELFPVDLTGEMSFRKDSPSAWLDAIPLERYQASKRWAYDTKDTGEHHTGEATPTLDQPLPVGAYVLRASAGGEEARDLVLVSDLAVIAKATGTQLLTWVVDVRTGQPVPEAKLSAWEEFTGPSGSEHHRHVLGTSGADGTALLAGHDDPARRNVFLAASLGERQAYALIGSWYVPSAEDQWRIWTYTDRPVYRPGDAVSWKLVARTRADSQYATPASETLHWTVQGPRGGKLAEGDAELDAFGSAWGKIETHAADALGEYRVTFERGEPGSRLTVGFATFFRLEEYKAPEFQVQVDFAQDEQGHPKLFRVGDDVEAEIDATYYYGAPVGGAQVDVVVYQRPLYRPVPLAREFSWLYDQPDTSGWRGSPGPQVFEQKTRTDAEGKAHVTFPTPFDANQDFEYTIEARVVDASRREISGQATLKVTRQQYFATLDASHAIFQPGAPVEVDLRTLDPNDRPFPAAGEIEVTRERWVETWISPSGKQLSAKELAALREKQPFEPTDSGWQERSGYEREVVAHGALHTGEDGRATWTFTPPREGNYHVVWRALDDRGVPITAETRVFVADESTRALGYRAGGVEILVDQDVAQVGEDLPILVATQASGRWVLFTVEAEGLLHQEVLQMDGTVKLVRLPITLQHVPDVLLTATMVADGQAYTDQKRLLVPPASQFLDVQVTPDRDTARPGEAGEFTVLVHDASGAPVSADVGLSVFDEALTYVQEDYAGDPRRFFYGDLRPFLVQSSSSFHQRPFVLLAKGADGELRGDHPERQADQGALDSDGRYLGNAVKDELSFGAPAAEGAVQAASRAKTGAYRGAGDTVAAGGAGGGAAVRVRSDFRDTALWVPSVHTDADGRASVELRYPDQTTRWRATARVAGADSRFGLATAGVQTRQPLIARLQAPRFFQVGDELIVSGNLNNDTDAVLEVTAGLEAEGVELLGRLDHGKLVADTATKLSVPAKGEVRIDWRVRVDAPGQAVLRLTAAGPEAGDAIERRYPVLPHGIEALVARAGKFRGDELELGLDLPAARQPGSTELSVQVTPSLAVTMLDALPYLVDYPYGCTEQTLSRFVPCAIVAKTMRDHGLSAEDAMRRAFGGIEAEHAATTHPDGPKPLDRLDDMIDSGLRRLYDFQHDDGGWGWWKEGDSDRYMTAYVLWGLSLARDAGVDVRPDVLESAARWLATQLVEAETDLALQTWMLHGLAVFGGDTGEPHSKELVEKAYANVMSVQKDRLNAYSRALLAIAAHRLGHEDDARVLLRNLYDGVQVDDSPDTSIVQRGGAGVSQPYVLKTAHWGVERGWRRWEDGGIEATAFALRAMLEIDPSHELIEPAVNWLVQNRRAAQWSNTRDTAIAVLALNEFLEKGGELDSDVAFRVEVGGKEVLHQRLSKEELLRAPSEVEVDPALLKDGENRIRIVRESGTGPLYFAAYARFFSQEEPIPPHGNEVFVRRDYYALVGRPTLLRGTVYDRVPLADGATLTSGGRVEVVITVQAKNDLEYLMLEDLKPAGLEAVRVRSGEPLLARELRADEVAARFGQDGDEDQQEQHRGGAPRRTREPEGTRGSTGRTRSAHQELRDREVTMFLDRLPQGVWELRYDLRAEVPGSFHALPLLARAMYVPEIRANGAETHLVVEDAPAADAAR